MPYCDQILFFLQFFNLHLFGTKFSTMQILCHFFCEQFSCHTPKFYFFCFRHVICYFSFFHVLVLDFSFANHIPKLYILSNISYANCRQFCQINLNVFWAKSAPHVQTVYQNSGILAIVVSLYGVSTYDFRHGICSVCEKCAKRAKTLTPKSLCIKYIRRRCAKTHNG